MIEYRPRRKARRQDTMDRLRELTTSPRSRAVELASRIHLNADSIREALAEMHGDNFKVKIGQDCSFVFVTRVR